MIMTGTRWWEFLEATLSDKTIVITLRCNFANDDRENAVVDIAKDKAREILALSRLLVANDRHGVPKMTMKVTSFFDDDVIIDINPTSDEVAAEAAVHEDPFADF